MSSKYIKLPIDVLLKKIKGMKNSELSNDLFIRIDNSDNLSKEELLLLIDEIEIAVKEQKMKQKIEDERIKKEKIEAGEAAQLSLAEQLEKEAELEKERMKQIEKERIDSMIISSNDFKEFKSAFGVFSKDENDINLFSSLDEQFRAAVRKYELVERKTNCGDNKTTGLRYFRARYNIKTDYVESKEFMHVNQNKGFVQSYEEVSSLVFACFRLFKNALSDECVFSSWWIINSTFPIEKILDETQVDTNGKVIMPFDFVEVPVDGLDEFLDEFKKSTSDNIINEIYLR